MGIGIAGYAEVEPTGEQGDEEGVSGRNLDHDRVLRDVRVPRVCRIREQCTRELPHRVRLLRALLAHRLRQRVHRNPPNRGVSGRAKLARDPEKINASMRKRTTIIPFLLPAGVLPADLRFHREVVL